MRVTAILVFFFYGYGGPRDLHSFPTRRSSDLPRRAGSRRAGGSGWRAPRPPRRRSADRKSTRLNSSHMSISYAVFCLKKKKRNLNIIQQRIEEERADKTPPE